MRVLGALSALALLCSPSLADDKAPKFEVDAAWPKGCRTAG